jgi:hypothetical protein
MRLPQAQNVLALALDLAHFSWLLAFAIFARLPKMNLFANRAWFIFLLFAYFVVIFVLVAPLIVRFALAWNWFRLARLPFFASGLPNFVLIFVFVR